MVSTPLQRGVGLVELMTALAIGSLLIAAAVQIFARGRTAQRSVTAVAALQENARFALSAMARDIERAGFYGLTNRAAYIDGRTLAGTPPAVTVGNDCGEGWSADLDRPIDASSNGYGWACTPYAGSAIPDADTLVLRHGGAATDSPEAGRIYVETARLGDGRVFVAPSPAAPGASERMFRALEVRGYYVSASSSLSSGGRAVPSLRVKTLSRGPRIVDEEVVPGIEDLQIELGIDTDAAGTDGFGAVDGFVTPDAIPAAARVIAVRIWLLVRAIESENGFTASEMLRYSDRIWPARDDGYRRAVFTLTVFVQNAPGP